MSSFKNLGMTNKEKIIDDLTKLIEAIKSDKIELSENIMDISAPFAHDLNIVSGKDECIYGIIYKNKIKKEKVNDKKIEERSIYDDEKRAINNIVTIDQKKIKKKKEKIEYHPMFVEQETRKISEVKRGRPPKKISQ